jgi:hypothetical protein
VGKHSQNAEFPFAPPSGLQIAFPQSRFLVEGGYGDEHANYNLTYDYGPIRVGFLPPPPIGAPSFRIATSAGELFMDPNRQNLYDWTAEVFIEQSGTR